MNTRRTISMAAACGAAAIAAGCAANSFLARLTVAPSPHERYADALRTANLHETALGRDWVRAGEDSVAQALAVPLPFRETGYLPIDQPTAAAYRLELKRGRRLSVEVTFESSQPGQLFVDLFELRSDEPPDRVASLAEGSTLVYDVPREHEGIDIVAARDTPVIAVVDGRAQTSTNALGGNVVWLRDNRTGRTFYYAHLERWAREGTASVRAGEVIGYVGNTGNARTTAPHLHFGIYERGAIDPFPFLQIDDPAPALLEGSLERLGERVRVTPARTTLRDGASRTAATRRQLDRASIARVLGISRSLLRVSLPDGATGYIDNDAAVVARSAIRRQRLTAGAVLRERPIADAPVMTVLASDVQVDVLGRFGTFELVRLPSNDSAWVDAGTG